MYGCREILRPPVQMCACLCEPTVISCLEWIKYLDVVSVNFRGFLSSTTIGGVVMTVWATIFEQCITLTTRNLCLLILISFVKDCISASTLDRRETLCLSSDIFLHLSDASALHRSFFLQAIQHSRQFSELEEWLVEGWCFFKTTTLLRKHLLKIMRSPTSAPSYYLLLYPQLILPQFIGEH